MGRKSKHRPDRGKKGQEALAAHEDLMALDIADEEKPRNAKQTSKLKKKLRKQRKKEMKQKGGSNHQHKKGSTSATSKHPGWHVLKVSGGVTVEKNFLFTSIGNFVEVEFQPLGFHKMDKMSRFYLEANEPAASAIGGLSKRIQGSDGVILKIGMNPCSPPDIILNSDQLQVLRDVMARRYNATSCLLDLTDLHHDPQLIEKDMLVPLVSPMIMKQVLRLISENIPHLKALSLSKNSLRVGSLKMIQNLQTGSSQLSALNLGHNYISDIQVLKLIKMFPLTELSLEFNPLVDQYKESPVKYITRVKKELTNLKLLDSIDVDAYLLENSKKVLQAPKLDLESRASSSSSAVSEGVVRTFLEQYYNLIDTQERSNLVAAYTPDAVLEIKSSIGSIGSNVFVGQSKISEALTLLPATQHQHSTFSLEVKLVNSCTALTIVRGQCQIAGVDAVVSFSRTMNIIPYNAGLCCSQDLLEIR